MKKALDEKYSYQIDENNVVHLFRGEEDCQQLLTNPLLSAIFKIEELEAQVEKMKCCPTCDNNKEEHTPEEHYRCKTCKKFCNWKLAD